MVGRRQNNFPIPPIDLTLRLPIFVPLLLVVLATGAVQRPDVSSAVSHLSLHEFSIASDRLVAQDGVESKWRRTRFGWVDTSRWYHPPAVEYERRIERIHPLVFAALLVLFAVGTLIWASEEYQWARLVHRKK